MLQHQKIALRQRYSIIIHLCVSNFYLSYGITNMRKLCQPCVFYSFLEVSDSQLYLRYLPLCFFSWVIMHVYKPNKVHIISKFITWILCYVDISIHYIAFHIRSGSMTHCQYALWPMWGSVDYTSLSIRQILYRANTQIIVISPKYSLKYICNTLHRNIYVRKTLSYY